MMKKYFKFLLAGAAALATLASCQREPGEEMTKDDSPEVNVQFVFNVATAQTATKQSAEATQALTTNTFRGLRDTKLLSYAQATNGNILVADAAANKLYDLAAMVSPGGVDASNTRRVMEMSLPIGTNTMLIYARAPEGTAPTGSGVTDSDYYGHMDTWTVSDAEGSADFTIGRRLQEEDKYRLVEKVIAGVLSCGLNTYVPSETEIHADDTPSGGSNKYKFNVTTTTNIGWNSYASGTNSPFETTHARYPLEDKLGDVYKAMTTISTAEIRAGSGLAIERTVQDMWSIINEIRCADPLSEAEAVAKYLADFVHLKMTKIFSATVPSDGKPVTGVDFLAPNVFADDLLKDNAQWPDASVKPTRSEIQSLGTMDLSQFPLNFNIPRGGAHYTFDSSSRLFSYVRGFDTSAMDGINDGTTYGVLSYYYPAELMYFGNSPIRTTKTERATADYPGTSEAAWESDASWNSGGWTTTGGGAVTSSTRAIAMKYNVNYGSSLLKTQVQYAVSDLYDNNHEIQRSKDSSIPTAPTGDPNNQGITEPNKKITVSGNSFILTGIIIGGQPHKVGWDYLPIQESVSGSDKYVYGFVYDRYIPTESQAIPTFSASKASEPVYTSVLDNYNPSGAQQKVYVALEFQNKTGADFYGMANVIRNDGYFYLIGELDPTGKTVTWPDNYRIPPYETTDGTSQKVVRVFIQDYMTSATFKLGENSLKHAYLTVPDLRSSSLTLGVSVDMKWESGINFDNVILGGN